MADTGTVVTPVVESTTMVAAASPPLGSRRLRRSRVGVTAYVVTPLPGVCDGGESGELAA